MSPSQKKSLREATALLEESENRYQQLVESVNDYAIFMLDPSGHISTWNPGAQRIKGYTAEEVIGKHFSIFYTKPAVEENFPDYELVESLRVGRFEDEGWRVKKDGSVFWANVIISPIYHNGKHVGFSKVTRDLTERMRNEDLMQKNKELLRINTDLDNFIYTASHDLRAPIANLEGLLEMLTQQLAEKIGNQEEEVIGLMHQAILRLRQTIADLTEVTKIRKDLEENLMEVSIPEVMEEVKKDLQHHIHEANADIRESYEVTTITFARAGLKSILYNLLSNAIKYRASNRPLKIDIRTYRTEDHAILSVTDNGLGLKKEQKAKLFTMFKRFHNHVEGTGIGLYIIKRIIENRGGWLEVESEFDRGSAFIVHFGE